MKNVCVIGGGASGLMAAYAAAENGNRVVLLEKNEKLGKKIYITGKGRCNITNDIPPGRVFTKRRARGQISDGRDLFLPPEKGRGIFRVARIIRQNRTGRTGFFPFPTTRAT